jgi:hypothetical protein
MSMVAINLEGFLVSLIRTLARNPPCFFSISIWILFAEIKAISMPEKKADRIKEMRIMIMEVSNIIVDYPVCVFQNVFCNYV